MSLLEILKLQTYINTIWSNVRTKVWRLPTTPLNYSNVCLWSLGGSLWLYLQLMPTPHILCQILSMGIVSNVDTNDVNNIKIIAFICSISLHIIWFFLIKCWRNLWLIAKIVLSCPNHSSTNSNKFLLEHVKPSRSNINKWCYIFLGS